MVQKKNSKAKKTVPKSSMTVMIKETILSLLESGDQEFIQAIFGAISEDVSEIVEESVSRKVSMIKESIKPTPSLDNSKPTNAILWDSLVEVASGERNNCVHEGKRVSTPAKGVGYQTPEKIKNWSSKMYTKLGGKWIPKNSPSSMQEGGIPMLPHAASVRQDFSTEAINNVASSVRALDENGEIIPGEYVQSDIMSQILKETKQNPEGKPSIGLAALDSAQMTESANTHDLYASDSISENQVGVWEALAFREQ